MEHKCNTCFYKFMEKDSHPCAYCEGYNKYVQSDVFKPDTETIRVWDNEDAFDWSGKMKEDNVNKPKHYTSGKFEVIDVIEDWDLNFRLANTVKYIARHKHKGKPLEDLKKAMWYLQREIDTYGTHT